MKPDASPLILTHAQVREVDRLAIEEFGIPGIVLMENAARGAAELLIQWVAPQQKIVVVCGGGNNGGDGYAIARHLANRGRAVELLAASNPAKLTGDAAINFEIVRRMQLTAGVFDSPEAIEAGRSRLDGAVVVDAVLGTGFSGLPRPPIDGVIEAINAASSAMVVAIDVPSGLDCDTGQAAGPCVRANRTITFVAMKRGYSEPPARQWTGEVSIVDIGAPAELPQRVAGGQR